MSEALPGMPPAPPPVRPRDAAAVVLYRDAPGDGVEVFWLRREAQLSFAGGYYAFPGGKLDRADEQVTVEGAIGQDAALRVAAARELFEEVGVLLASGDTLLTHDEAMHARRQLLAGTLSFESLLRQHGLTLYASSLLPAGRYITPDFYPVRFDCRFFLAKLPAHAKVEFWPGELAEGAWVRPVDALKRWREGTALLHPPNLNALKVMADFRTEAEACARLSAPKDTPGFVPTRVEFQEGIRVFPVRSPTLFPATHTNTYLLGNRELLIVDPGSPEPEECERLASHLRTLMSEGMKPVAIFLTHHHSDHIGGAAYLRERLQLPVWAHARTADRLPFPADRTLREGDVLRFEGSPVMQWRVLLTPGHAQGHLCLVDEATHSAVVGDMVAGFGTILIDPPEGDMAEYLRQLRRLRDLPVRALFPAHGPPLPDGPAKLDEYLVHRELREARVLEALSVEAQTLEVIAQKAYADTPNALPLLTERNTEAILLKLSQEGKAVREQGDGYRRGRC